MKRATPDLIVCRYAKARHEKLVQLTETAGDIARTGMEDEPECVISVLPEVASTTTSGKINDSLVPTQGIEPRTLRI